MSIKIMTMVFDRYPNGGGEMLLALTLADFSDDEGRNIFPSVETMARKSRQSPRTVQRNLRTMETIGWLLREDDGDGGRSRATRYRINPAWIKGDKLTPLPEKGATTGDKGCQTRPERVTPVSPAYIRHDPSMNHHKERARKRARFSPPTKSEVAAYCKARANGIDPAAFVDFYESKQWMVGKNKMRDWQAAVRTWEARHREDERRRAQRNQQEIERERRKRLGAVGRVLEDNAARINGTEPRRLGADRLDHDLSLWDSLDRSPG